MAARLIQGANWFVSGLTLTAMGALGDWIGLPTALHALVFLLVVEFCLSLALPAQTD